MYLSNFAATSNTWIGTVGAVRNKSSLIGIGMLKKVFYYSHAIDFVGQLGMQESKAGQAIPKNIPTYSVSIVIDEIQGCQKKRIALYI